MKKLILFSVSVVLCRGNAIFAQNNSREFSWNTIPRWLLLRSGERLSDEAATPSMGTFAYWNSFCFWPGCVAGNESLGNEAAWSIGEASAAGRMSLNHEDANMREWWIGTAKEELNPTAS